VHKCVQFYGNKPKVSATAVAGAGSFHTEGPSAAAGSAAQLSAPSPSSSMAPPTASSSTVPPTPASSRRRISPKKRRRFSEQTTVLEQVKKMHQENQELEKKRLETMEKMHNDKMAMFGQFLDCLKGSKE